MRFLSDPLGQEAALETLFRTTFTAAEGADEGAMVGALVQALLAQTPAQDIRVFCLQAGADILAAGIFTRLVFPQSPQQAWMLSPMAVAPTQQRRGLGKALLGQALDALRAEGATLAFTYGDPAYYAQTGFRPISESLIAAPLPLSMPHGWLGQNLAGGEMPALSGRPLCVPALNRPEIW